MHNDTLTLRLLWQSSQVMGWEISLCTTCIQLGSAFIHAELTIRDMLWIFSKGSLRHGLWERWRFKWARWQGQSTEIHSVNSDDSPGSAGEVGEKSSSIKRSTWQALIRSLIPCWRKCLAPHKQGYDERGRKEVETNSIWPIHHIREDWRQCFSSQFSSIHADALSGERWKFEALWYFVDHGHLRGWTSSYSGQFCTQTLGQATWGHHSWQKDQDFRAGRHGVPLYWFQRNASK